MNEHSNKIKFTPKPKSKNYYVDFLSSVYLQGIIPCFPVGQLTLFSPFSHIILKLPAQPSSHMLGIFWFMARPTYQLFQLLSCSELINASIILHVFQMP